jgi:hypothetical protein
MTFYSMMVPGNLTTGIQIQRVVFRESSNASLNVAVANSRLQRREILQQFQTILLALLRMELRGE